jgi:hypothetical protein
MGSPDARSWPRLRVVEAPLVELGPDELLCLVPGRDAVRLTESERALLAAATGLDTLPGHARRICQGHGLDPEAEAEVVETLGRLAAAGVLREEGELLAALARSPAGPAPALPSCLGILTRDRADACLQAVAEHLAGLARQGRSMPLVVMDDSRAAGGSPGLREGLAALARSRGAELVHLDLAARRRFAAALGHRAGVAPAVTELALADPLALDHTPGAARNALLLGAAGDVALMLDDDMTGRLAPAAGARPGLALHSGHDPTDLRFFPDREAALAAVTFAPLDLVAVHAGLLGRTAAGALAAATPAACEIDRAAPGWLSALARGSGRVAVTSLGLVGDSGMRSTAYGLLLGGAAGARHRASYALTRTSREVLRGVQVPTISDGMFLMGAALGLDARAFLPPFLPAGRGSDGAFCVLLRLADPGALVGHLPVVAEHAPSRRSQSAGAARRAWATTELADLVVLAVLDLRLGPAIRDPAVRLEILGRHLSGLGALPPDELGDTLRPLRVRQLAGLHAALGRALHEPDTPEAFARDVERARAALVDAMTAPDLHVPRELLASGPRDEAPQRLAAWFAGLGALLDAWPALLAAARELRAAGADPFATRGAAG